MRLILFIFFRVGVSEGISTSSVGASKEGVGAYSSMDVGVALDISSSIYSPGLTSLGDPSGL